MGENAAHLVHALSNCATKACSSISHINEDGRPPYRTCLLSGLKETDSNVLPTGLGMLCRIVPVWELYNVNPKAKDDELGEYATEYIDVWAWIMVKQSPVVGSHNLTDISKDPERILSPAGDQQMEVTGSVCPSKTEVQPPDATSHTLIDLSPDPEATEIPLGDTATELT